MDKDYAVFVHILNAKGEVVFQADHDPLHPTYTSTWTGKTDYTRQIALPEKLPDGVYRLKAGLWSAAAGRQPLQAGKGVIDFGDSSYLIGTFTIDHTAPPPPLDSDKPVTLDLTGYKLTFRDEFEGPLDVSTQGSGTKWIAYTPFNMGFGEAAFTAPGKDFPFTVANGLLRIEARKTDGKWRSGLLASVDPKGRGFSQQFGYFEMRAKFPKGPGNWPAFWLCTTKALTDRATTTNFEVDIIEQYGHDSQTFCATYHWWYPDKTHKASGTNFSVKDMTEDFHTYGFLYDAKQMIWYFDGVELWRQPTPPEACTPLYVLVNLALGGGWPIDQTPSPSYLFVDYIRVYALPATSAKSAD